MPLINSLPVNDWCTPLTKKSADYVGFDCDFIYLERMYIGILKGDTFIDNKKFCDNFISEDEFLYDISGPIQNEKIIDADTNKQCIFLTKYLNGCFCADLAIIKEDVPDAKAFFVKNYKRLPFKKNPEYIPFTIDDWNIFKNTEITMSDDYKSVITEANKNGIYIKGQIIKYDELLKTAKFANGNPFGKIKKVNI